MKWKGQSRIDCWGSKIDNKTTSRSPSPEEKKITFTNKNRPVIGPNKSPIDESNSRIISQNFINNEGTGMGIAGQTYSGKNKLLEAMGEIQQASSLESKIPNQTSFNYLKFSKIDHLFSY